MSTVQDLMGLGMPGPLASRLGNTPTTVTTTGTTQAAAAAISTHVTILTPASSQTGALLPSSSSLGQMYAVNNPSSAAVTALVYCPVSGTMNGTTNGSLALTTGKTAIFLTTASLTWVSILTA